MRTKRPATAEFPLNPTSPVTDVKNRTKNDQIVNAADYTIWANGFGSSSPQLSDRDFNGDGSVDASNYTVWANNFGQTVAAPSGAAAAVPEPSTFLLAIVGIIGLSAFRRRRRR